MLHIIHKYKEIAIDKVVCEPWVMHSMYKLQSKKCCFTVTIKTLP